MVHIFFSHVKKDYVYCKWNFPLKKFLCVLDTKNYFSASWTWNLKMTRLQNVQWLFKEVFSDPCSCPRCHQLLDCHALSQVWQIPFLMFERSLFDYKVVLHQYNNNMECFWLIFKFHIQWAEKKLNLHMQKFWGRNCSNQVRTEIDNKKRYKEFWPVLPEIMQNHYLLHLPKSLNFIKRVI